MSQISSLKILIVEDDLSLLRVYAALLRRKGATVYEATNGREALEVLHRESVNLVLSDVQMPEMDGLELLETIRRRDPKIPVVLLVTGQARINEEESIEMGSSGLLRKPVRSAVLLQKIEDLFPDPA